MLLALGGLSAGLSIYAGGNIHATVTDSAKKSWTFTVAASTPTEALYATVTQSSSVGELRVALTGASVTQVVVTAAASVTFNADNDLVIGSTTIVADDVSSVADNGLQLNGVADVLVLGKATSGTAANGIGSGLSFGLESDGGTLREIATMEFALADVTGGSEAATMTAQFISIQVTANIDSQMSNLT